MIQEYTSSLVLFVIGIAILIWQFIFPDPIPDLVTRLINQGYSEFAGLDFTLKAFLLFYTISGFISIVASFMTAFLTFIRSHY